MPDPGPGQPYIGCPCCKQPQSFHRPSLFVKVKDLLPLGPEIPYLFYFLEVLLILIICSVFIEGGQFLACGFADVQQCRIFRVEFDLLDYRISLPVGFSDITPSLEYIYIIVISTYFIVMFLIELRLNMRYIELSQRRLGYADFSVMLCNVPPQATK